jgi:hypothetical protein
MCLQSVSYAVTAVEAAGGPRSWVASHIPAWLAPPRRRLLAAALLTVAVLALGVRA